jgi:phosphoserine phosphatase
MTADARQPDRAARKLAVIDVDGTLTGVHSIWQFLMEQCGCWVSAGERNLADFLAGAVTYEEFCQLDARLFAGRRYDELCEIASTVPLRDGLDDVFDCLWRKGYYVALISTGLRVLTRHVVERYSVDVCLANDLEAADGLCTGRAIIEVGEHDKGLHSRRLIEQTGAEHVVAIGDSAGDLPMFATASMAIAVNAVDRRVVAAADAHVTGPDLSVLCQYL